MKNLFLVVLLSFSFALNAQYVTINDPALANMLNTYAAYSPCMSGGNQLDTACLQSFFAANPTHEFDCSSKGITDPSAFKYFTGLDKLDCSYNSFQVLPQLPQSLTVIRCEGNALNTVTMLPNSLEALFLNGNNLSSLPPLPNTLIALEIPNNQFTTNPPLPNGLTFLSIGSLYLTSVQNLPSNLTQLVLNSSPLLNSLPFPLPSTLLTLNIQNCNFTYIPDSLPQNLTSLHLDYNNLVCLPKLPTSLTQFKYLNFPGSNNPNANIINCTPNYLPNLVVNSSSDNVNALPLCTPTNINNCNYFYSIAGQIYEDANTNCTKDVNENIGSGVIKLYNSSNILVSQLITTSGYYSFADLPNDTYTIVCDLSATPFVESCVGSSTVTVNYTGTPLGNNDFGVLCESGFDVGVWSASVQGSVASFFPGLPSIVTVNAGDLTDFYSQTMNCASGVSGSVDITITGPVTYVSPASSALTPSSISGNTYTYSIADFGNINSETDFRLAFTTDVTATSQDTVTISVNVTPTSGDNDLTNNSFVLYKRVQNSFDPNIKEVSPLGDVAYPYSDPFIYTIHFQNTGDAPAVNIKLVDTLDANLDVSSFKLLGYSNPVLTEIVNGVATFTFAEIMLPDSLSDPEGSIGFVQYSIEPNGQLPIGTIIKNKADIYFDYNSPITTNETVNTIVQSTASLQGVNLNRLSIYPNPTTGLLTIKNQSNDEVLSVKIYSVSGELVLSITEMNSNQIDLSDFVNGVYFCEIQTSTQLHTYKVVKS